MTLQGGREYSVDIWEPELGKDRLKNNIERYENLGSSKRLPLAVFLYPQILHEPLQAFSSKTCCCVARQSAAVALAKSKLEEVVTRCCQTRSDEICPTAAVSLLDSAGYAAFRADYSC